MLASSFLDTAIGVIFVFLLLSLIATTVNEIIMSLVNMRGRMLLDGIKTMLDDPHAQGLVNEIYNQGQIYGLYRGEFRLPQNWMQEWQTFWSDLLGKIGRLLHPSAGRAALSSPQGGIAGAPSGPTKRNLPAYIPAGSFVSAFVSVVLQGASQEERDNLDHLKEAAAAAVAAAKDADQHASEVLSDPNKSQDAKDAALQAASAARAAAVAANISVSLASFRLMKAVAQKLSTENEKVGKPLLAILETAENDIDKLKTGIENWFNSAMDRVSGWYKYHTQVFLFWIGIVIAVALNANTVTIVKQVSTSDAVRQALVAAAAKYPAASPTSRTQDSNTTSGADKSSSTTPPGAANSGPTGQPQASGDTGTNDVGTVPSDAHSGDAQLNEPGSSTASTMSSTSSIAPGKSSNNSSSSTSGDNGGSSKASAGPPTLSDVAKEVSSVTSLGLPLGWGNEEKLKFQQGGSLYVLYCCLGWLLTAIAVSLGAPFWFDLLNKFMVVRSTVKPQEKSQEEGSKDKQP
jgi:hypothetical protein